MNESKYKLSVRLMTYNHSDFICKAIDGILLQKTNFLVEVVIGDDFSTDDTLNKIITYNDSGNIHFKILNRQEGDDYCVKRKELGRIYNFVNILNNCTGKYIALLDGDDYWIDPLKLQKQVDFLEKNENFVLTYHDSIIVNEKGTLIKNSKLKDKYRSDYSSLELQKGAHALTLSLCFRNLLKEFPDEIFKVLNGDKFLISLLGNFGEGKYMSDIIPSGYRVHSGGIWSSIKKIKRLTAKSTTYYYLYKYHKNAGNHLVSKFYRQELKNNYKMLFLYSLKKHNYKSATKWSLNYIKI